MQLYKTLLKIMAIVCALVVGGYLVFTLGVAGFALDFKGGANTMYWLLLPFFFVVGAVLLVVLYLRRQASERRANAMQEMREQTFQDLEMGSSLSEHIMALLEKRAGMTAAQLAKQCGRDEQIVVAELGTLLRAGKVSQDTQKHPTEFFIMPSSEEQGL